jgi:signal transduction histidine kinase
MHTRLVNEMVIMSIASLNMRISMLVDWFLHPSIKTDRDLVNQARVFLISHIFGPVLGSAVPAALFILDPTPGFEVAVLTVSIAGFWVFPFLLRAFGRYNLLSVLSVQNLIFCILWSCYFYGGIKSPTLPWVLTIPLLAFFYIGPSTYMRSIVIGLFAANVAVFLGVAMIAPPVPNDVPAEDIEGLGIVSTVAVALYVTMMALYYAKVFASQSELESEMRGHLATSAELKQATEEAERAGAAKAEFLAKMSHELRTPLNAVIGYSQMLLEDASDEGDVETVKDLEKIHGAGHHLLKLINEVLDLSKIDAGMMEVYYEEASLAGLVRETVDECRAHAAAHNNIVSLDMDNSIGPVIIDQQKVKQILSQVLDNAVKFTRHGFIRIRVTRSGDEVQIAVNDTGVGISPADLPTLFEQFTVLGDASSSKYGGTGLGLALSQKLCRLMGGDISVRSESGVGSCFTISFVMAGAPTSTWDQSAVATQREQTIFLPQMQGSVVAA